MNPASQLRILMVHNRYLIAGGEDMSTDVQVELLRSAGHDVYSLEDSNARVDELGLIRTAARSIWSGEAHSKVDALLAKQRFDVMHVQNSFPLFSPSVLYAAAQHGVPVVQSLRNFRLLCPEGMLHRDGRVCTDCTGKRFAWPSVRHRCYRDSALGSLAIATMSAGHSLVGTWRRKVFRYVTPSYSARKLYVDVGWREAAIDVIPNFIYPDPSPGAGDGGFALFAGRLDPVKGLNTLIEAWTDYGIDYPLRIVGAGPLQSDVESAAAANPLIEYLGVVDRGRASDLMGQASFVVVPTVGIETFGRVAAEAIAKGTPAVVADHGGLTEIVTDGETGVLFPPGEVAALAERIHGLIADPGRLREMRALCRQSYHDRFSGERALNSWTDLYREATEA